MFVALAGERAATAGGPLAATAGGAHAALLSPSLTMPCDFFCFVLLLSGCDESSFH